MYDILISMKYFERFDFIGDMFFFTPNHQLHTHKHIHITSDNGPWTLATPCGIHALVCSPSWILIAIILPTNALLLKRYARCNGIIFTVDKRRQKQSQPFPVNFIALTFDNGVVRDKQ